MRENAPLVGKKRTTGTIYEQQALVAANGWEPVGRLDLASQVQEYLITPDKLIRLPGYTSGSWLKGAANLMKVQFEKSDQWSPYVPMHTKKRLVLDLINTLCSGGLRLVFDKTQEMKRHLKKQIKSQWEDKRSLETEPAALVPKNGNRVIPSSSFNSRSRGQASLAESTQGVKIRELVLKAKKAEDIKFPGDVNLFDPRAYANPSVKSCTLTGSVMTLNIEFQTGALCFPSPPTQLALKLPGAKQDLFSERTYSTGVISVSFEVKISMGSDPVVEHSALGDISSFQFQAEGSKSVNIVFTPCPPDASATDMINQMMLDLGVES